MPPVLSKGVDEKWLMNLVGINGPNREKRCVPEIVDNVGKVLKKLYGRYVDLNFNGDWNIKVFMDAVFGVQRRFLSNRLEDKYQDQIDQYCGGSMTDLSEHLSWATVDVIQRINADLKETRDRLFSRGSTSH